MITVAYLGRADLDHYRAALGPVRFVPVGPCDLGVSIGASHIFTPAEIARARFGIVNLHFAPLPEYRGRWSAGHALRNGEQAFGATLHYVDAGIDTGPVIEVRRFPIPAGCSVDALRALAFEAGGRLWATWAPRLVAAAERGERVPATPQDEARARYYDLASRELLA